MGFGSIFDATDLLGGGGGLDLFGTKSAAAANAANAKRAQQAMRLWSELGGQQNLLFNRAEGALQESLGAIKSGYGAARNSLLGSGDTARRGILAREKQQLASTQQSLVDRGLYGSTTLDNAAQGINVDTTQQLSAVDETIGRLMAELQIDETQATAGALRGMAAFNQARYGALADLTGGQVGTLTGMQDVAAPGLLQQIAPFAALAFMG